MIILGIDTALPACSVAVLRDGAVLAGASEPMTRGHQERLATLAAEVMTAAGLDFAALDRVAVTIGPGSFTGLRVGLAFAKGLALALGIPCVGVGALEALAASVEGGDLVVAAIDAKRGQVYLQGFFAGAAVTAPAALDIAAARARLLELRRGGTATIVGSGAELIAPAVHGAEVLAMDAPRPEAVARLGAAAPLIPPRPLYLRAPDARLPAA